MIAQNPIKPTPAPEKTKNLQVEVTNIIHQMGVPAHIKGYQYLRDAILLVIDEVNLLGAVTKEPLSYDCREIPNNTQQSRKGYPPCY